MTASHTSAAQQLDRLGYLDLEVDPTLDLVAEINRLKKEKNAQQYRLESDLVTVRTQNEQVSFQLEAGFLAQQIQMTTGLPCEAKAEIIVGKDKKKEVLITLFIE